VVRKHWRPGPGEDDLRVVVIVSAGRRHRRTRSACRLFCLQRPACGRWLLRAELRHPPRSLPDSHATLNTAFAAPSKSGCPSHSVRKRSFKLRQVRQPPDASLSGTFDHLRRTDSSRRRRQYRKSSFPAPPTADSTRFTFTICHFSQALSRVFATVHHQLQFSYHQTQQFSCRRAAGTEVLRKHNPSSTMALPLSRVEGSVKLASCRGVSS